MRKIIILVFSLILIQSCLKSNPDFIIYNKSNKTLDTIVIGVSNENPSIITNVKKDEYTKGKVIFDDNIKGDGDYFIEIYNKSSNLIKQKRFGYYTNGKSLNNIIKIFIYNDSIAVSYR